MCDAKVPFRDLLTANMWAALDCTDQPGFFVYHTLSTASTRRDEQTNLFVS
jgi:hypothetical protein